MDNIINKILQIKEIKMFKTLVVLGLCLAFASCQFCWGEDCQHRSVSIGPEGKSIVELSEDIEDQLRRQYWFYLNGSVRLYRALLVTPDRLLFLYFHRNIVGTFFSICSWNRQGLYSEVHTLVRLGGQNVQIFPMALRYQEIDEEKDESIVISESGEITNVTSVNLTFSGNSTEVQCQKLSEEYMKENYWFYLLNAKVLSHQELIFGERKYTMIHYENIVGKFMSITTCDDDETVHLNTFVRFGLNKNSDPSITFDVSVDPEQLNGPQ